MNKEQPGPTINQVVSDVVRMLEDKNYGDQLVAKHSTKGETN